MKIITMLIICFLLSNCSENQGGLRSKEEVLIKTGCLVSSSTKGEQCFKRLISKSSKKDKKILCVDILKNNELYHLHNSAGHELEKLYSLQEDSILKLLLKTNFYIESSEYQISNKLRKRIINSLNDLDCKYEDKQYFIEALYSLSKTKKAGIEINNLILNSSINDSLKKVNNELYFKYEKYKPAFEKLASIETWMEMDENSNLIKEAFTNYHPIVFNELLFLNPSTVLKSKELSVLKKTAIENMLNNGSSFYEVNKLTYLKEMLHYGNYSIQFLEKLISEKEFKKYLNEIENI